MLAGCASYGDLGYSSTADPFEQLDQASQQASQQTGQEQKLILLIAGGDWCRWCYVLHDFLKGNARVNQALLREFVVVKVYFGDKRDNQSFFDQLPQNQAYPYFWILSADKQLYGVQDPFVLESGSSYDETKFLHFVQRWKAFKQDV